MKNSLNTNQTRLNSIEMFYKECSILDNNLKEATITSKEYIAKKNILEHKYSILYV